MYWPSERIVESNCGKDILVIKLFTLIEIIKIKTFTPDLKGNVNGQKFRNVVYVTATHISKHTKDVFFAVTGGRDQK